MVDVRIKLEELVYILLDKERLRFKVNAHNEKINHIYQRVTFGSEKVTLQIWINIDKT